MGHQHPELIATASRLFIWSRSITLSSNYGNETRGQNCMKAAIYTGIRQIEIQEVAQSEPAPGYVLLDTQTTGICGSDLHNYFGEWQPAPGIAQGHETCGVVAAVGPGVIGFQPGDLVVTEVASHCGECVYCQQGHYNHCVQRKIGWDGGHGGFAEYTTAHASSVFKLPENFSFEQGALVEPVAVCYRALTQARASFQDRVAVIGGGTIGLLTLAVARAVGVKETLITVKYPHQAAIARNFGADHIVNIADTNVREYVADHTNGLGMDVVIETTSSAAAFNDSLAIVRRRGTVVLVGGYHQPLEVDLRKLVWSEPLVTGSNCYAYSGMVKDFDAAIDLIATGKVDPTPIVTHRFPLDQIAEAFAIAADKSTGSVKVQVTQ